MNIKILLIAVIIYLSIDGFSQETKKHNIYISFGPNTTFGKVTFNDKSNRLSSKVGPAINLMFGYTYFYNNKWSFSTDINYAFINYKRKFNWDNNKSNDITALPIIKLKMQYSKQINNKYNVNFLFGAGIDIYTIKGTNNFYTKDSINLKSLEINTIQYPTNNIYIIAGVGIAKINSNYLKSINLIFNKGLFTTFKADYNFTVDGENNYSQLKGTATHLNLELIFYLRKSRLKN